MIIAVRNVCMTLIGVYPLPWASNPSTDCTDLYSHLCNLWICLAQTLWSENVEYGSPSGSGEGCRDGDGVLTSTQLSRQGCDRKGRSALPGRHGYRSWYPGFSCVT